MSALYSTPVPKPLRRVASGKSQRVSSSARRNGDRLVCDIIFPPGAMGLVLEPLIPSEASKREIGCKVKEFQFGIDDTGIDEGNLRSLIMPGDILSAINGSKVLFHKFHDVMTQLELLKHKQKRITFKKFRANGM